MCLDIETGRIGTAVQTCEGAGVSLDFGYLAATERASQLTSAQGAMQLQMQAIAANTTHKSGPQENGATQRGHQATTAARPAQTRTCSQHK